MSETAARARWMAVLAKAPDDRLSALWEAVGCAAEFEWLRRPETGSVMVQGRAGGTGAPFNLGEMTVTRAALRLASGTEGHAYVAGRDRRKAEIAALCDALLQEAATASRISERVIEPLVREMDTARRERSAKAAATKVEFFTMARGED